MSALAAFPMSPIAPAATGTWMTKQQICTLTGCSPRSIERYAQQGALSRTTQQRGRNGKILREFMVEELPGELRVKIAAAQQPRPVAVAKRDIHEVAPLFARQEPDGPGEGMPQAPLSPKELRLIELRFELVELLLSYSENRDRYKSLRLANQTPVTTMQSFAAYLAETRTVNGKKVDWRTLFRWLKRYRQGGKPALARKPNANRGQSSFFKRYPAAAELAKATWLVPAAPADRAYRAILRNQDRLGIPDAELPSYATVRRYLDKIPQPIKVLAREGQRRWNETAAPHLTRDYTTVRPGTIYTSDHMIHDVEVRNDCFVNVAQDAPMRLRFTCIMDLSSRKIVGYAWTADGDSLSIATALRRAVERYGVPDVFYCDNGSDYKKLAKGALHTRPTPEQIGAASAKLEHCGALQQLGIKVQMCLPYRPQGKNIERAFRTVHMRLDSIFRDYLTGSPATRPDAAVLIGTEHRRLQKMGLAQHSRLMPASYFIRLAETYIEQQYNAAHEHNGQGMKGRTPNEVFEAGNPPARRRMADAAVLSMLLFDRKTAIARRGEVTLNKQQYVPISIQDKAALHLANRESVVVAFDPNDPSLAFALDQHGRSLCALAPKQLSAHPLQPTAETALQIAQISQERGRLLKSSAIVIATSHERSALAGHTTELQHLAQLAAVTAPADADLISQKQVRRATRPSDDAHAPASSFDIAAEIMEMLA
jgi:putative transposase